MGSRLVVPPGSVSHGTIETDRWPQYLPPHMAQCMVQMPTGGYNAHHPKWFNVRYLVIYRHRQVAAVLTTPHDSVYGVYRLRWLQYLPPHMTQFVVCTGTDR